jgi:hypothetical protein
MDQEQQSREIAEQAERLIAEAETSGKLWREKIAQCEVQLEDFLADYVKLRPGITEMSQEHVKRWVEEDFPAPKRPEPAQKRFRTMI